MIQIGEWFMIATISDFIFKKQYFIKTFFKQSAYHFRFISKIS